MRSRQNLEHPVRPDESYPQITSRSQRRAGHIFGHSPSPSTSSSSASSIISEDSFVLIQKPRMANPITTFLSPLLKRASPAHKISHSEALRLRAVPDSKPKAQLASKLLHIQPLSISPISPTFSIDFEKKQATRADNRLRKINKLAKTFGENIPPELVFPNEVEPIELPVKTSPRPLPKLPSQSVFKHESTTSTDSPAPTIAERRRGHRPRSLSLGTGIDVLASKAARLIATSELEMTVESPSRAEPPRSNSTPPTKPCSNAKSCRELALRSMTVKDKALVDGYGLPASPPPFQTTVVPKADQSNPAIASEEAERRPPRLEHSRQSSRSSTHLPLPPNELTPNFSYPTHLAFASTKPAEYGYRKEREWSGEWNLKDMQDIMRGLRDLRGR